jgi:hypothetical protein
VEIVRSNGIMGIEIEINDEIKCIKKLKQILKKEVVLERIDKIM